MEIFIVSIVYIHLEQIMHLKKHERLCDNNDYYNVEMPTQFNKTLKHNYGEKSLKTPFVKYNYGEKSLKTSFVIYADVECLLLKKQSCQNNPNESYTERKAIHEPCGYALSLASSFYSKRNKEVFIEERIVLKGSVVI